MTGVLKSTTLSVSIHVPPQTVYEFVSNPENLGRWATAFCRSVHKTDDGWRVETRDGPVGFRFVPANEFGVLDHFVTLPDGAELMIPMRVVPNGSGSEVLFTVFRWPAMSEDQHREDVEGVERDLTALKHVLES